MTASEVAFLALGLVLGVATGAALIEVLRARPPVTRQIRVTVAPNAIQGRRAATLAETTAVGDPVAPAEAGPGDRRWRESDGAASAAASPGRRLEDRDGTVEIADQRVAEPGTPVRSATAGTPPVPAATPSPPFVLRPTPVMAAPTFVAVPIHAESEPFADTRAARSDVPVGARAGNRARAAEAEATAVGTVDLASTTATASGGSSSGRESTATGAGSTTITTGACAEERRVAEERCALSARARERAATATAAFRDAQHSYDDLVSRADAAAATADPRAVRAAKEGAQQRFHEGRNNAGTRDDVEAAARAWLAEINQINQETREANARIERDRAAAAALATALERLAVEADAARIASERADEACLSAREAVAACDEARNLEVGSARTAAHEPPAGMEDETRIAAAMPGPEDEFTSSTAMQSQAAGDAVIIRILRGDHDALERAVARLAGDDPDGGRRWQQLLGGLAEALIARSIEACVLDFPIEHPFWGLFTQAQNRDVAAGLSSLGYRFDGFGDWADDHLPSQRDLSLAVGYAGLDPMRVRHWPTDADIRELWRDVRVAADEYVAAAAGGLTLGELVTLLGRRADGLTELWNEWGSVRPILLEAS